MASTFIIVGVFKEGWLPGSSGFPIQNANREKELPAHTHRLQQKWSNAIAEYWKLTAARSRYHHELRGTILKVDQAKNEFTIKTYHGQVVECLINAKTVLKNSNGRRITFSEVHAGDQAYCHCDRTTDGKHYSVYLLVK